MASRFWSAPLGRQPHVSWRLLAQLFRVVSMGASLTTLLACSEAGPANGASGGGGSDSAGPSSSGAAAGTGANPAAGGATPEGDGGAAAGGAAAGGAQEAGTLPSQSLDACTPADLEGAKLQQQVFDLAGPPPRVLFSWTTAEQEAGLRAGDPLYSLGEVEGLGRGISMDALFAFAAGAPEGLENSVAAHFPTFRYAWTNPWATRMGFGGEDYGNRLIRIELKDEAWVATLEADGRISRVTDLSGTAISLEEAARTPERIAALFFQRVGNGGPYCGTFLDGDGGYREFILGNASLVKRWEVGSEAIIQRLEEDIAALTEYLELTRPCTPNTFGDTFNASVVCRWGALADPYLEALALPGDAYIPTAGNIARIIDTLTGDLFEPDPFIVELP